MNTSKNDFGKLKFIPFDLQNILLNNSNDLDGSFLNSNQFCLNYCTISQIYYFANYFTIEENKSKHFYAVMTKLFQYFI